MKIGIVGLGLIGGSLGRVMTEKGHTVFGADKNPETIKKARSLSAISEELTIDKISCLDMLIVAVFSRDFERVARQYLPYMKKGAILSDVCGNKRQIMSAMQKFHLEYPEIVFLGTHPMAGREYSGIEKSTAKLFNGASIIVVLMQNDKGIEEFVSDFYLSLGFGKVVFSDAENHDKTIAYTSQLCHIVSNAFIKSDTAKSHAGFSAGSYLDLTRVARLNPEMWAELMIDNRDKLAEELDTLIENLQKYADALKDNDEDGLKTLLDEGNKRKTLIDKR